MVILNNYRMKNHFLGFLISFFLISTFSMFLESRLSVSRLAMLGLSALKVKRCLPRRILNLVTFLFFLIKTAAFNEMYSSQPWFLFPPWHLSPFGGIP